MSNAYLERYRVLHEEPDGEGWNVRTRKYEEREKLVHLYAWAVPEPEAIKAIAALSPIVEIGAGGGYWAKLLSEAGADVYAVDNRSSSTGAEAGRWFKVHNADENVLADKKQLAQRTLMLCWPPYWNDMAAEAVKLHRGKWLVYIGESEGGCTATDEFFRLVEERYEEHEVRTIPRWLGLHDYVTIYKRKEEP